MIKNWRTQKGSGLLVGLIILTLVVVGGLGFIFWNSIQNKSSFETSGPKSKDKKSSLNTSSERDSSQDVINLSNWGVKITIVDRLRDAGVQYLERKSDDSVSYAFTTSRIQNLGGKCNEQPFGDTVILHRQTEKPIATPDGELINEVPMNGYYYILTSPIASCSGFDENDQIRPPSQKEVNDRAALKESIKSLSPIE